MGNLTIGIGRNLDDKGISEVEARFMLDNDLLDAADDLDRNVPWWADMPDQARRALLNMAFNLGWPKLSKFKKMLAALKDGDFDKAAEEALDSIWAGQVGARAHRIAHLYRESI